MYIILTHLYYSDTNLSYLIMLIEENAPINVLNYLKMLRFFFQMHILLIKILIEIPIMVESTERCFSKLKLIKSYLRFTMS